MTPCPASLADVLQRTHERQLVLKERLESDFAGHGHYVLEIGCGHGHWLAGYAAAYPDDYCIGIDLMSRRIEKTLRKKTKQGLNNLRAYKAEANEFLDCLPPGVSFERVFIMYPDPWPKQRHHRRRLLQSAFLSRLAEYTLPGAQLYFRTDQQPYFEWACRRLRTHSDWQMEASLPWPYEQETFFQKILPQHVSFTAVRL